MELGGIQLSPWPCYQRQSRENDRLWSAVVTGREIADEFLEGLIPLKSRFDENDQPDPNSIAPGQGTGWSSVR